MEKGRRKPEEITEEVAKQWFKVNVRPGHLGARKIGEKSFIIFAKNALHAFDLAKQKGGWHKNLEGFGAPFPDISPLSFDEDLE